MDSTDKLIKEKRDEINNLIDSISKKLHELVRIGISIGQNVAYKDILDILKEASEKEKNHE